MTAPALTDLTASELEYVVAHEDQRAAAQLIADLVTELRGLSDLRTRAGVNALFELQRELGGAIYEAERKLQEASRILKRIARGSASPDPPGERWELERILFERIARQLRTVGDALAWRLFRFDRRIIIVLARNQASGLMIGKEGLGHELGAIVAYRDEGTFALLHAVTNCLRIADLTAFEADMPRLQEIKAGTPRGSRYRAQRRRAERALAVINANELLGDDEAELFSADAPLKSMFPEIRDALMLSAERGHSSIRIGNQHVVTTWDATTRIDATDDLIEAIEVRKRRTFERANLAQSLHHLNAPSIDVAGRNPSLAPATIFPLRPAQAAAITTDLIGYDITIGWDRLAHAFERRGFDVDPPPFEPSSGHVAADAVVLSATKRGRRLQIYSQASSQLLLEALDPDRYADGVTEYVDRADDEIRAPAGVVTFRNERAVWR